MLGHSSDAAEVMLDPVHAHTVHQLPCEVCAAPSNRHISGFRCGGVDFGAQLTACGNQEYISIGGAACLDSGGVSEQLWGRSVSAG
jgi:hypothetical protein